MFEAIFVLVFFLQNKRKIYRKGRFYAWWVAGLLVDFLVLCYVRVYKGWTKSNYELGYNGGVIAASLYSFVIQILATCYRKIVV